MFHIEEELKKHAKEIANYHTLSSKMNLSDNVFFNEILWIWENIFAKKENSVILRK